MSFRFEIEARDGKARAARFFTPHGAVETPVFMPVGTLGTVKAVAQDVLEELGVEILLNNTYHLYLRPGVEMVRQFGGVQRFMAWDKPILTDSGGFQVFSLSELRKVTEEGVAFRSHLDGSSHMFTPESSIAAQIGLGADIIMAFDECTEHPAERSRAQASMEMTLRWLQRSRDYFEAHKEEVPWFGGMSRPWGGNVGPSTPAAEAAASARDDKSKAGPSTRTRAVQRVLAQDDNAAVVAPGQTQALFGIVQGGMYPDLRRESAERTVEIDLPGYAIGGLSVGEPRPHDLRDGGCGDSVFAGEQAALSDGGGHSGRNRALCGAGRGHDGLRAANAGGASWIAVHVRRKADNQECTVCAVTRGRSIRSADARFARAIRGDICGTFTRLTNCWHRR